MFMYILSVEGYGQIHPARPCSHDFMENFGSGLCAEGAHAATVRLHRGSAGSDGAGDPLVLEVISGVNLGDSLGIILEWMGKLEGIMRSS